MSVAAQSTTSSTSSTLNAVLVGSIGSVIATGILYFVGGAYYDGYSKALGLGFLAGLQPTECIFYGAQFLIDLSIPLGSLMLVTISTALRVAQKGIPAILKRRFSLKPEYRFVVGLIAALPLSRSWLPWARREYRFVVGLITALASILLQQHLLHSIIAAKTLITSSPCSWPINPNPTGWTWTSVWF